MKEVPREAEVQTSIGKALGALTLMASISWHVWLRGGLAKGVVLPLLTFWGTEWGG